MACRVYLPMLIVASFYLFFSEHKKERRRGRNGRTNTDKKEEEKAAKPTFLQKEEEKVTNSTTISSAFNQRQDNWKEGTQTCQNPNSRQTNSTVWRHVKESQATNTREEKNYNFHFCCARTEMWNGFVIFIHSIKNVDLLSISEFPVLLETVLCSWIWNVTLLRVNREKNASIFGEYHQSVA